MSKQKTKNCYITTPIYYASGSVQIGNSYTTVVGDVLARFYRSYGYDTWYLTGMDEHGQKIEEAALKANITPQQLVDQIALETSQVWASLGISNNDFIRTTEDRHKKSVQAIFEYLLQKDDIYLGTYSGDYCVSCETFFTKSQLVDGNCCPDCGKPTRVVEEESYFLRLKKYSQQLLDYILTHPDFIQPETRRNEVVAFIESGLEDLCISRTTFQWGIPILSNPKHVIYVWIDALSNYLTALNYHQTDDQLYQKYWLDNSQIFHIVGKDILRFHAIFWPIMLLALNIPLNFRLYVHGWILNRDGKKISKSRGGVVYPLDLVKRYGVDPVRYYLAKELPLGNDGLFSYERFVERYNSELANDLGNLVSRTIAMINKYNQGISYPLSPLSEELAVYGQQLIETGNEVISEAIAELSNFRLQNGINRIWTLISRANKFIDETAPWVLAKDPNRQADLRSVLSHLAEVLRVISSLVEPILIETAPKIISALGLEKITMLSDLVIGQSWQSQVVSKLDPLFKRCDLAEELAYFKVDQDNNQDNNQENNQDYYLDKQNLPKVSEITTKAEITIDDFRKLDLKVGQIVGCSKHPKADKLLVLEVNFGQTQKTIVSGIAKNYQPEQLIGKKVVVVYNLAEVTLRGVKSQGMILCAEDQECLEIVELNKVLPGAIVN